MIYVPNKFVFYHIPKTGGSWFIKNMLENCNEYCYFGSDFHYTPDMIRVHEPKNWKKVKDLPRVICVRNPLSWYLSFWKYKHRTGWGTDSTYAWFRELYECKSMSFPKFCDKMLRHCPGFLTNLYQGFLGPRLDDAEYIVKQEDLANGLWRMLKLRSVDIDKETFYNYPAENVSDPYEVKFPKGLKQEIADQEKQIMEVFGYEV